MKIISWNINGIRAIIKKDFLKTLNHLDADLILLQETKIGADKIRAKNISFPGYEIFWNPAERPGYSGTAILVRTNRYLGILEIKNGMGAREFDVEGRVQILESSQFYLLNAYFPNANRELSRLDYKLAFNQAIFKKIKKLTQKKPVILAGDYNVAHEEVDLARPKENIGNAGFTDEERAWMSDFLSNDFIDLFRYLYPEKQQYTWWSYRTFARKRNIGWRIDYFCVSKNFLENIENLKILEKLEGSDHCPVELELKFNI